MVSNSYTELTKKVARNNEVLKRAFSGEVFSKIAKDLGITRERVRQIVKRYGDSTAKDFRDSNLMVVHEFKCNDCHGSFFLKNRTGRKFCSSKCRVKFCLKNMQVDQSERINSLNGGIRPPKKYINHYYGMSATKPGHSTYRSEHRLIMEKHLGRKLKKWEHVHHIDGDGRNNKINNLKILSQKEHARLTLNKTWIALNKTIKVIYLGRTTKKRVDIIK